MPGKRSTGHADYITPRALYRVVTTPDTVGIEDDINIPYFDTGLPPNVNVGMGQSDYNQYGRNAQIDIAVIPCNFHSVSLELWLRASLQAQYLIAASGVPPSPTQSLSTLPKPILPLTESWVLVESKIFTGPGLWIVRYVPPGQYKIKVAEINSSSSEEPDRPQESSSSGTGEALNLFVQYAA